MKYLRKIAWHVCTSQKATTKYELEEERETGKRVQMMVRLCFLHVTANISLLKNAPVQYTV